MQFQMAQLQRTFTDSSQPKEAPTLRKNETSSELSERESDFASSESASENSENDSQYSFNIE